MERFYVTKKVLANGNKWSDILGHSDIPNSNLKKDEVGQVNYFGYKPVREAWAEMENHFCAETVMSLITELDRIYTDEYTPSVVLEEINRVVVKFTNKNNQKESVCVEYVMCGAFLESELAYSEE